MDSKKLQLILNAPGIEGKTVKPLCGQTIIDYIRFHILNSQLNKDLFYVLDLGIVASRMEDWSRQLPTIKPFYAVKCNSEPSLLAALAALGCNFDCASKAEIQSVLSLGVSPNRIIYANPCKAENHLKFAASVGVNLTTVDSVYEISKITKAHPKCALLLRVKVPEDTAPKWSPLGSKFGALPEEVEPLLKAARNAGLTVLGVSFHIGTGATNPDTHRIALAASKKTFDVAAKLGMPPFTILNIGGGFTAGAIFDKSTTIIKAALQEYFFAYNPQLTVIAEPGTYFAETPFTLATNIIGKRVRGDTREYWLDDGVYGSFLCVAFGIKPPPCVPLAVSSSLNSASSPLPMYKSTLFGPTCDSLDKITDNIQLPELEIDDWLVFPNMGAYASATSTGFNGLTPDVISYLVI